METVMAKEDDETDHIETKEETVWIFTLKKKERYVETDPLREKEEGKSKRKKTINYSKKQKEQRKQRKMDSIRKCIPDFLHCNKSFSIS